VEFEFY